MLVIAAVEPDIPKPPVGRNVGTFAGFGLAL
jgi:hypothetical protein